MRKLDDGSTKLSATFIYTMIQVFVKVCCGLVINKVVAVLLGPSGLALIGQFQNFYSLCVGIASGSIDSGVVKYTAQYKDNQDIRRVYWLNSIYIYLAMSSVVIIIIMLFSDGFSSYFFEGTVPPTTILMLGFTVIFSVLNLFLIAVINGLGNHKLYSIINILISVYVMLSVASGAFFYGVVGVVFFLVIAQSSVFFVTLSIVYRYYRRDFFAFNLSAFRVPVVKKLLSYGLVSFVSGASSAVMLIAVRNFIVDDASLEYAGYWEALWKISIYFVMFGSLPASIYFLPKYAALNSIAMIRESFLQSVRFILPVLMAAGTFIYLFSSLIVKLLFSPDFLLIAPVIGFMLIGDFIKVAGYLVVNIMYAKGFMRQLIAVDIVSNLLMLALVSVLFPLFKLHGLTYSYIIANTLIFLYLMFFYCKLNDRLAVNVTNDA